MSKPRTPEMRFSMGAALARLAATREMVVESFIVACGIEGSC